MSSPLKPGAAHILYWWEYSEYLLGHKIGDNRSDGYTHTYSYTYIHTCIIRYINERSNLSLQLAFI